MMMMGNGLAACVAGRFPTTHAQTKGQTRHAAGAPSNRIDRGIWLGLGWDTKQQQPPTITRRRHRMARLSPPFARASDRERVACALLLPNARSKPGQSLCRSPPRGLWLGNPRVSLQGRPSIRFNRSRVWTHHSAAAQDAASWLARAMCAFGIGGQSIEWSRLRPSQPGLVGKRAAADRFGAAHHQHQ